VRVWDLEGRKQARALEGKGEWITSIIFSPNGELVLFGSSAGVIGVWPLKSDRPLLFPAHSDVVTGLATQPTKGFYSTTLDGITKKWDVDLTQAEFESLKKRSGGEWVATGHNL
jgi:WD40 repeat protein